MTTPEEHPGSARHAGKSDSYLFEWLERSLFPVLSFMGDSISLKF
jgi:hypothetical protein